jgi:uncharacterized protein YbbK (DUF523 family)
MRSAGMDSQIPKRRARMVSGSGEGRAESREGGGGSATAGRNRGMEEAQALKGCAACAKAIPGYCSPSCREWETFGEKA